MRKMKDSDIDWIGKFPDGWNLTKMKMIGCYINGYAFKPTDWNNSGKTIIRIQDLTGNNNNPNYYDKQIDEKYLVKNGDILVSWAATLDAFYWNKEEGWLNQHIFKAIPNERLVNRKFFFLLLKVAMENMNNDNKHGIVMQHVTIDVFNNFKIVLPCIEEQEKIVDFLEKKVEEIDNAIEKTKKTIKDYKKYKQSIITEIVTKGLEKNKKMKETGIDWIKTIPENWKISPLKNIVEFGKGLPITKADLVSKGNAVISYGQIHSKKNKCIYIDNDLIRYVSDRFLDDKYSTYKALKNDFIFADTSEDLEGTGNCVYIDREDVFAGYHTIKVHPISNKNYQYLAYLFMTDCWRSQLRARVSGIKLFSITQKILKETTVIIPTDVEMKDIVKKLNEKCANIENIIESKQKMIEELKKYKKSLIYEYVTGKKEVSVGKNTEIAELSLRIIEQLPHNYSMCKIKLNKIQSVISKMIKYPKEPDYEKYAAGPYNKELMNDVYNVFKTEKWVKITKNGMRDVYTLDKNFKDGIGRYKEHFKENDDEIIRIIKLFENKDTQESEIIATLFYCWNDFLIDGIQPTDEQIIEKFYNWSKRKKNIKMTKVKKNLVYMKTNNLVPNGYGKKTIQRSNNYGRK